MLKNFLYKKYYYLQMNNNLIAIDAILKIQLWVLLKNLYISETKCFLINVYNNKLKTISKWYPIQT